MTVAQVEVPPGTVRLTCPWHGWQYDLRTGFNEFDHALQIQTYPVHVEGGDVRVQLPDGSGPP